MKSNPVSGDENGSTTKAHYSGAALPPRTITARNFSYQENIYIEVNDI